VIKKFICAKTKTPADAFPLRDAYPPICEPGPGLLSDDSGFIVRCGFNGGYAGVSVLAATSGPDFESSYLQIFNGVAQGDCLHGADVPNNLTAAMACLYPYPTGVCPPAFLCLDPVAAYGGSAVVVPNGCTA
jgi:hypothetical protein